MLKRKEPKTIKDMNLDYSQDMDWIQGVSLNLVVKPAKLTFQEAQPLAHKLKLPHSVIACLEKKLIFSKLGELDLA